MTNKLLTPEGNRAPTPRHCDSGYGPADAFHTNDPYKDAGGRLCLLVGKKCYYLNPYNSNLMCCIDVLWTDKYGKVWRTPNRTKVHNKRIRSILLTASIGL